MVKQEAGRSLMAAGFLAAMSEKGQKRTWRQRGVMSALLPKADMKSFDDLVGDLVAPYRIDTGIPSNRDAKGEHEGRC
jgi:hypothetical protein